MSTEPIDIKLPHNFIARHYQEPMLSAFVHKGIKRFCFVCHRRGGKDKLCLNICVIAAMTKVGNYIYLFPETTHAKKVIWKGIDSDGKRFIDHFPKELIKSINNVEMLIELVNGSTFQLMGSNQYDKLRGINPLGIVFSEYQAHHPIAWETLRPILAENKGWVIFQGTPKGPNHFYDVYNYAKEQQEKNKSWYCAYYTVNDTYRDDGTKVVGDDIIQEERDSGMPEELIQQEYFCSFHSANTGSFYGKLMEEAEKEKRIIDFEINPDLPVFTFWDLGVDDPTAIWLMQYLNAEIRLVYYYENNGEGIQHYVKWLEGFAKHHKIKFGEHFAPHDIKVKELGSGRTRLETALKYGINFRIAPNIPRIDGINAVRVLMPKMFFNKTNCKLGIRCIRDYHTEYDSKRKCYNTHPAHDYSSHAADALRYLAVSWQTYFSKPSDGGARIASTFKP